MLTSRPPPRPDCCNIVAVAVAEGFFKIIFDTISVAVLPVLLVVVDNQLLMAPILRKKS